MPPKASEEKSGMTWLKLLLGPAITIAIVAAGFTGQWAVTRYALEEMEKKQTRLEQTVETYKEKMHEMELKVVVESSDLATLKEDIAEIKKDIKTLLGSN